MNMSYNSPVIILFPKGPAVFYDNKTGERKNVICELKTFISAGAHNRVYQIIIDGDPGNVIKIKNKGYLSNYDNVRHIEEVTMKYRLAKMYIELFKDFLALSNVKLTRDIMVVPTSFLVIDRQLYEIQPKISGTFIKFTNNAKFINGSHTMLALSHFTIKVSDGMLMMTDLQGWVFKNVTLLTDLTFHKPDSNWEGSRGTLGIRDFLANHECNDICNTLRLLNVDVLNDESSDKTKGEATVDLKGVDLNDEIDPLLLSHDNTSAIRSKFRMSEMKLEDIQVHSINEIFQREQEEFNELTMISESMIAKMRENQDPSNPNSSI
jgi:hypothetical protein